MLPIYNYNCVFVCMCVQQLSVAYEKCVFERANRRRQPDREGREGHIKISSNVYLIDSNCKYNARKPQTALHECTQITHNNFKPINEGTMGLAWAVGFNVHC